MRLSARLSLSAALLASALLAPYHLDVKARAAARYDCEGNACSAVTLTWDADQQKFRAQNSGSRPARVEAFNWAGGASVLVQPGTSEYLSIKSFDGPYHANFE
jgi:hypothetical protein